MGGRPQDLPQEVLDAQKVASNHDHFDNEFDIDDKQIKTAGDFK